MNELEFEIGRQLGSSCFFIYQTIKHLGQQTVTTRDVEIETGLSDNCVYQSIVKLRERGILDFENLRVNKSQWKVYKIADYENWRLH